MAKYKASPFYAVKNGDSEIRFGMYGDYETADAGEIKVLDALCPRYLKRVDEPVQKAEEPAAQAEADANPATEETPTKAAKPANKRKTNATSSTK